MTIARPSASVIGVPSTSRKAYGSAGTHTGGDPGDQMGGQMTDRRLVVPVADHQPLVLRRELGIDPAGLVGSGAQHLTQQRIPGLGNRGLDLAHPGLADLGNQTGVRADRGQGREPVRVADPSSDDRANHRPHAGSRGNDAGRVGVGVEVRDSLVDLLDLTGQEQCLFDFVGDVLSELGEVHPVRPVAGAPQGEGLWAAVMSPAA